MLNKNTHGTPLNAGHPQRWDMTGGFSAALSSNAGKSELRGWLGLAIGSLAIAGVFALLLAFSRLPGIQDTFPWPLQFFKKGLVIHVIFSFVVWFLSTLGAISVIVSYRLSDGQPKGKLLSRAALYGSYLAAVLLFIPGFMDRGLPSLSNYIPVIIDPIYYAGLGLMALSMALICLRMLINLLGRVGPLDPVTVATLFAGIAYFAALVSFFVAWSQLGQTDINDAYNEALFWGGGHTLQFVNVILMMSAWYILGGIVLKRPVLAPRFFVGILLITVLAALALPSLYYFIQPFDDFDQRQAFTYMQYALAPPVTVMMIAVITSLLAARKAGAVICFKDSATTALSLSILVFSLGGILGLFVDGADTRTPAHYHGVIGGVNLAFMGLFITFFLPLSGRKMVSGKSVITLIHLYAWGQILHSLGLFLAGGYGAPRKTAGAEQGIVALGAEIGLYMMGVGALIAVIGGVMFIWKVAKSLFFSTP